MASRFRSDIRSFLSAVNALNGKEWRIIGNNTFMTRVDPDTIAARLHYTDIVTYHRDGRIIVNTGGHKSATTKHRINGLTGVGVYQKDYNWFLCDGTPFVDGMDVGGISFSLHSYALLLRGHRST
jgi:hypothetical protein